jgi:hypothetical protein
VVQPAAVPLATVLAFSLSTPEGGEGWGENSPKSFSRFEPLNRGTIPSSAGVSLASSDFWKSVSIRVHLPRRSQTQAGPWLNCIFQVHGEAAQLFPTEIASVVMTQLQLAGLKFHFWSSPVIFGHLWSSLTPFAPVMIVSSFGCRARRMECWPKRLANSSPAKQEMATVIGKLTNVLRTCSNNWTSPGSAWPPNKQKKY